MHSMRAPIISRKPSESVVRRLLTECALPTDDIDCQNLDHYFALEDPAAGITGVVGLEIRGRHALLRSLAVSTLARGNGYGQALVAAAENFAREKGVEQIYLLTTTAARFFERLGYGTVDRTGAPEEIRKTRQFSSLCPASSSFMRKELEPVRSRRNE